MSWAIASVTVPSAERGGGEYSPYDIVCQSGQITWAWGSEPATANLTYIGAAPCPVGAAVTIKSCGYTFYGRCQADTPQVGSDGQNRVLEFVDNRYFLDRDCVFGAFNLAHEHVIGNIRVKLYKHMLPANYPGYIWTFTSTPYTAREILDFILASPNVKDKWTCTYHPDQDYPIFDLDFTSSEKLRSILTKIGEAQGLVFTLMGGPFQLVWARKGEGTLPDFTHYQLNVDQSAYNANPYTSVFPLDSDQRVDGYSSSDNPTRILVLGDRNKYQVHGIVMEKDWLPAWEQFYDPNLFYEEMYRIGKLKSSLTLNGTTFAAGTTYATVGASASDPEQMVSRQLARADALAITVGEYSTLKNDTGFYDTRRFNGRSRIDMPVMLYLRTILWRAFRFPAGSGLDNANGLRIPIGSLRISDKMLAKVEHDPITGEFFYDVNENPEGAGYAIARGYQVGRDLFKTIRPDRFKLDQWNNSQSVWEHVEFQVDATGEEDAQFILFDEPIINSADLITMVDGYAVFKAAPTITTPPVQIAACFEAERFLLAHGNPYSEETEVVPGLNAEFIVNMDGTFTEIPFSDGLSSSEKAIEIADSLLSRQVTYRKGSYVRHLTHPFPAPQTLNGCLDRITLTWGPNGANLQVSLTAEKPRRIYIPERDLDRNAMVKTLLPGQAELRHQANIAKMTASALKVSPVARKTAIDAFHGILGNGDPVELAPIEGAGAGTTTLPVGTPVTKKPLVVANGVPQNTRHVLPASSTSAHIEFGGVVTREGVVVPGEGADLVVQRSGDLLARVRGPIAFGDSVYLSPGNNYLDATGEKSVATALQDITEEMILNESKDIFLIKVRTGNPGTTTQGGDPRWR